MSESLSSLFLRSVANASKAFNAAVVEDSTQELVRSTLIDLTTLSSGIEGLALFSPNETLEDISTGNLIYLLVPYVLAVVRGRIRTPEREERISVAQQTQITLKGFVDTLENYAIVPNEERALYKLPPSKVLDPSKRREIKIKQYQKEKELKSRIEISCKPWRQPAMPSSSFSLDLDLISTLLPVPPQAGKRPQDECAEGLNSETEEVLRDATLLLIRFCYTQAQAQLESINQELELLVSASSLPPALPRQESENAEMRRKGKESDANMWKLDRPGPSLTGKGPLLDPSGKPLRPFTILPSGALDQARLHTRVFGPDYTLPTMSIDEYLQIEGERGNIITGGGAASEAAPTSSEKLALEAEMDGTVKGNASAEKKRQKDESWATFTDENPRGAGNTMNRG